MTMNSLPVGVPSRPAVRRWARDDAMLYAVAVGAGQDDPSRELEFTTENTEGLAQQVLPTFANTAMSKGLDLPATLDYSKMLHAEQSFHLHRAIPPEGEVESVSMITGVYDKGSGALIRVETRATDGAGHCVATLVSSVFFQGYGGFGGDRGPRSRWEAPTREPDHVVNYRTRVDQALLYRLTGDRNPLHTDPTFSRRGGFDQPILHGMCTYGFTGRALLHTAAQSQPTRVRSMSARFTKPILPGEQITVAIWVDGDDVSFRTSDSTGAVVIDCGSAVIDSAALPEPAAVQTSYPLFEESRS